MGLDLAIAQSAPHSERAQITLLRERAVACSSLSYSSMFTVLIAVVLEVPIESDEKICVKLVNIVTKPNCIVTF